MGDSTAAATDEHLAQTLGAFASHVGLRGAQPALGSKYLALHINVVPTAQVYALVGTDYQVLKLKTQSPPLEHYAERQNVDVPTFIRLMKNQLRNVTLPDFPTLSAFRDEVIPRPVGEEQWFTVTRSDAWKDTAYLMALNFRTGANFYPLCRAIYDEGENSAGTPPFERVFERIKNFDTTSVLDPKQAALDIGRILCCVHSVGPIGNAISVSDPPNAQPIEAKESRSDSPTITLVENKVEDAPPPLRGGGDGLSDFRKRNNLNAGFSPEKLAKQSVCAALGITVCKPIMSRHQRFILPLSNEQELHAALDAVDSGLVQVQFDADNLPPAAEALAAATNCYTWSSADLLKHMMHPEAHLNERVQASYRKKLERLGDQCWQGVVEALS